MAIRIGCQVNCWPLGPDFDAGFVKAVQEAGDCGYAGIEVNWRMTKTWEKREEELKQHLADAGLCISALFFGAGSAEATAARQEIEDALRCAAFLRRFGATTMVVGGGKATDDQEAFKAVCRHYNDLGRRLHGEYGVKACYHLHHGAIASKPEDIERMMAWTDTDAWFLCPDTGIMASEGHDLQSLLQRYAERIPYVHFKDWAGADGWAMLGEGIVDHKALVNTLRKNELNGWIISENESRKADLTPKEMQASDRQWLRNQGL